MVVLILLILDIFILEGHDGLGRTDFLLLGCLALPGHNL